MRRFSARRLLTDIDAILEAWDVDQLDMRRLGDLFRKTYSDRGASRLIFWVALSGRKPRGSGLMQGLIEAVHEARERRARAGLRGPADIRYPVCDRTPQQRPRLDAGRRRRRAARRGGQAGEAGAERFLDWVADLLDAHLDVTGD